MSFYYRLIIFLLLNLGALWLGSVLQAGGSRSDWYQNLQIAPWTPPGWAFGAAWLTIMLCFSFFMTYATDLKSLNLILVLFLVQLILNTGWNAVFFRYHEIGMALLIIILLTVLIAYFVLFGFKTIGWKGLFVLPYFIWLLVATSLNWYTWVKN